MSEQVWPGRAVPARRDLGRRGHQLLALLRARRARRALPVRRRAATRRAIELTERDSPQLALLPARASARASATATASTGPTTRSTGHRFNPRKLLLDPTRRRSTGRSTGTAPTPALRPRPGTEDADLEPDDEDDAAGDAALRGRRRPAFDWEGDRPPRTPWNETVIYETHVKGFTMRHPGVREDLRGTYAGPGLRARRSSYLRDLGVTAVELLPVHHIVDESFLAERGLTNYWGYSSIGFLAPHAATRRPARAASRCASSRAWSRRCTGPASR